MARRGELIAGARALAAESLAFEVSGRSMWPTLESADLIHFTPHPPHHIGDILLFDDGQRLIVHRLHAREDGAYVTKGDNCRFPDAPVSADSILGRVTTIVRDGRLIPVNRRRQRVSRCVLQFAWIATAFRRRILK